MCVCLVSVFFFFFKQKTAYEMRISDWSSDVCSSDLGGDGRRRQGKRDSETMETSHENPLDQGTQASACSKSGAGRHCINGLGQQVATFKADRIAPRSPSAPPGRTARA